MVYQCANFDREMPRVLVHRVHIEIAFLEVLQRRDKTPIGQFLRKRGQRPLLGAVATVAVNRGIPEDLVEPRHQRLVRQIRQPVQVSREGVLQEVFGQGTVTGEGKVTVEF